MFNEVCGWMPKHCVRYDFRSVLVHVQSCTSGAGTVECCERCHWSAHLLIYQQINHRSGMSVSGLSVQTRSTLAGSVTSHFSALFIHRTYMFIPMHGVHSLPNTELLCVL
eukprot:scpid56294/ scgid21429/ 